MGIVSAGSKRLWTVLEEARLAGSEKLQTCLYPVVLVATEVRRITMCMGGGWRERYYL